MMTPQHILLFLAGLLYGGAVAFAGYKLTQAAVIGVAPRSEREVHVIQRRLTVRWWLRLLIDAVALFVLFKLPAMMIGAALGIILFHKILIVKYIKQK